MERLWINEKQEIVREMVKVRDTKKGRRVYEKHTCIDRHSDALLVYLSSELV
jgi:hypothetical protein